MYCSETYFNTILKISLTAIIAGKSISFITVGF